MRALATAVVECDTAPARGADGADDAQAIARDRGGEGGMNGGGAGPGGRGLRALLAAGAVGALVSVGGWFGSERLEQDDRFCNACHLDGWVSGTPLHTRQRDGFAERPPRTLAGSHATVAVDGRAGDAAAFRCMDCHGGVGFVGKLRVKALAAKDAFFWVVGAFDEPDHMRWPLLDDDCRQCHASFAAKAGEFEDPAFHDLGVHNADLGVDCVECHLGHDASGDPEQWFVAAAHVRAQCARCHERMAGEM